MKQLFSNSVKETFDLGAKLGRSLKEGDIVCLFGDLGTGKTAFTGGIAKALGIIGYITSPTFTIVNEYNGKVPLYHFDVYRISDSSEMFEIGFEEYLEGKGVMVIEWAGRIEDILPGEYIRVEILKDYKKGSDSRILNLDFIGHRYDMYEGRFDL